MRGADAVVVNSLFTRGVVEGVWGGLGGRRGVRVVYPCVDTGGGGVEVGGLEGEGKELWGGKKVVLSINRFERKKDVGLAIRAFAGLGEKGREGVRLVIAGLLFPFGKRLVDFLLIHRQVATTIAFRRMSRITTSWCHWPNL